MRVVTVKVEEDMLEELDLLAKEEGVRRSELIREAIRRWLERNCPDLLRQK